MTVFLILGAALAPCVVHEAGHWVVARVHGVQMVWAFSGWRLVWAIHADAAPSESVRRQIAISGFWLELLGALVIVAAAHMLPILELPSAVYAGVAMAHLWDYAVMKNDPAFDDFSLLRRGCGNCGNHDS